MKEFLVLAVASLTVAAETGAPGKMQGARLSSADCESLWKQSDAGGSGKISETAASTYLTELSAVNKDGDKTIEKSEFSKACEGGMIKESALPSGMTTGSTNKSGASSSPSETSDRTPEKMTPTPQNQDYTKDGATSDRTPK